MWVWKPDCPGHRDFSVTEYITDSKICLPLYGICETSGVVSRVLARRRAHSPPPLLLPLHVLTESAAKSRGKPDNASFGDKM
jgi:hypothetical protein